MTLQEHEDTLVMGVQWSEMGDWKPDSVASYKVMFITSAMYKNREDFNKSVIHTMNWLEDNGYVIIGMYPKYGYDMTRKIQLKFMYFQYVEVKNE
jgi:hypothetical protein